MQFKPLRTVTAAAVSLAAVAAAHAIPLVGLTSANEIARFDSASPAAATRIAITGLAAGDRLVGIDLRPGNNTIYGVSQQNRIYTINELTGLATFAVALSSSVVDSTLGYGIDFNPNADFNAGSSLRLVSSAGSNFAINANTGVVGNAASDIGPGFTAVAYTNSNINPPSAPATSLYYIDTSTDTLKFAPGAFNAPTIQTIGSLGVDALRANGFEIAGGMAYAALNVDDSSLASRLYTINLSTGAATSLGDFNGTLTGLTVSAVPEPGTYAMFLAGMLAVGAMVKRRGARG